MKFDIFQATFLRVEYKVKSRYYINHNSNNYLFKYISDNCLLC